MKHLNISTTLSLWCGFLISLGALAYLVVGGPLGALLFAFGLISVINTGKRNLYTGWVGICNFGSWGGWGTLIAMLTLNAMGVLIGVLLTCGTGIDIMEPVANIIDARYEASWLEIVSKSIYTGIIMHICVWMALYKQTFIPTLIGVPLFILCGFPHCIADVFYYGVYLCCDWDMNVLWPWFLSIVGNTIGCNIPALIDWEMCK